MEDTPPARSRRRRSVALLTVGVLVGMLMLTPASAHFTQNTRHLAKHAWQQFIKDRADDRYARGNLRYLRSDAQSVNNGLDRTIEVPCPGGWHPTGGGVTAPAGVQVAASHPSNGSAAPGRSAWRVIIRNASGGTVNVRAYVVCARVNATSGNYAPGAGF